MSFTINSVVFKVFLPILVGLAIFATLDSIKVDSLDPQVESLGDALNSFNREIVLAKSNEDGKDDTEKARSKFREAVIFNVLSAQHCGLTGMPEKAVENNGRISDYRAFNEEVGGILNSIEGGGLTGLDSSKKIFYPDLGSYTPYKALREDDNLLTCAGSDQLSSNVPGVSQITTNEGNDMEGRYGRIGFEVQNNFTIDNPRIAAFSFPGISADEGAYPQLLLGSKQLVAAPDGCEEQFYDSRLRMQNVPMIAEGTVMEDYDLCDTKDFAELVASEDHDKISYMMCGGAVGYIQTNIGGPAQTGEATSGPRAQALFTGLERIFGDNFIGDNLLDDVSDELLNIKTFPELLIRQEGESCIEPDGAGKGIVADDSQVIGPAIDHNNDGDRETCEFGSLDSYGENSEKWSDLKVKCGLKSLGQDRYSTVWYAANNQECEAEDAYQILPNFQRTSGSESNVAYGDALELQATDSSGSASIEYNLRKFDKIQEIRIAVESNRKSAVQYRLKATDGSEYLIESDWDAGLGANGYEFSAEANGETESLGEISENGPIVDYDVVFDSGGDKLSYGTTGSMNTNINEDIDSLSIEFSKGREESQIDDEYLEITSIRVEGDLSACS